MPANSKTVKSSKQSEPVTQVAKKQTTAEVAPAVVAPAVVAAPKQKGGKKAPAVVAPVVVAPAVVAPAEVAPAEVAPVVQKAGAKKAPAKKVAAEVAPVATEAPAKVVKAKVTKVKAVPEQKAAGKAKKEVAPKQVKAKKVAEENDEEGEDDKGVRSFKVQLPGTEDFSGRFTGLTPYQAANKALSKYFRENKNLKSEITFAIRESTRGSKRSTYTYNGKREKLVAPVKYSIKGNDGQTREIVKEYKNKLVKVKKADSKTATVAA